VTRSVITIGVVILAVAAASAQPVIGGKTLAPRYVLWGEGTTDEMCLGILQTGVTPQH
jgi:hypothetical protein